MAGSMGTIIFFSPHPDDEILSSGAFLSHLKDCGWRMHIVYMTSGSDVLSRDERESEASIVCRELGAAPIFLRSTRTDDSSTTVDRIICFLRDLQPDVVVIPSPQDPHPTHDLTHRILDAAMKRILYTGTIMYYSIWQPLLKPNFIFPFGETLMDRKIGLLELYPSQLERNDFIAAVKGLNRFHGVTINEISKGWTNTGGERGPFIRPPSLLMGSDPEEDKYAETFFLLPSMIESSVLSLGDIFLDVLPDPIPWERSEGSSSTGISLSPGGNATNFAMAFSSMGGTVALYSKVGSDGIAELLERELHGHGVRTFLQRDGHGTGSMQYTGLEHEKGEFPGTPIRTGTAVTCALSFDNGTRRFFSDFGSNLQFQTADLPQLHTGFKHLHRAGYFWLPELLGSPNEQLLRSARELGMTTSMDIGTPPGSDGSDPWTDEIRSKIHRLLSFVDILFGNEAEILGIWGDPRGEDAVHTMVARNSDSIQEDLHRGNSEHLQKAASGLIEMGCGTVVIHRGALGASLFQGAEEFHAPAHEVYPENPTGAGDVFNAGFIFQYLNKESIGTCLEFAVAAGTYHVARKCDPYPTLEQINSFLEADNDGGQGKT